MPFLLGFAPQGCLVVLALADSRVQVTARLDLPTPGEAPAAVTALAWALSHLPVSEVIVIGYGDEDDVTPVVTRFAASLPWPVREVLRVQTGRWWSLTCPDPACCPPGALLPVDDAVSTALLVANGSPAASRADLAAALQPSTPGAVAAVRAALDVVPPLTSSELYAAVGAARAAHDGRHGRPARRDAAGRAVLLHAVTAYQRGDGALAVLALERATGDDPGADHWERAVSHPPNTTPAKLPAVPTMIPVSTYAEPSVLCGSVSQRQPQGGVSLDRLPGFSRAGPNSTQGQDPDSGSRP